jgi:hypothetical protein
VAPDGTVYKTAGGQQQHLLQGEVNPADGFPVAKTGWYKQPDVTQIFLKKGATNPVTKTIAKQDGWQTIKPENWDPKTGTNFPIGPQVEPGAVRFIPDPNSPGSVIPQRFNANTGVWEKGPVDGVPPGQPENYYMPPAEEKLPFEPTTAAKYAANGLKSAIGKIASFSMGAGNLAGGVISEINAYNALKTGHDTKDPLSTAEGVMDVISGAGYIVAGASGIAGAVGLLPSALAGVIAGPALAVGGIFSAAASIISVIASDAKQAPSEEQWANDVMNQFGGTDVFKNDPETTKKLLEQWYKEQNVDAYYAKQHQIMAPRGIR